MMKRWLKLRECIVTYTKQLRSKSVITIPNDGSELDAAQDAYAQCCTLLEAVLIPADEFAVAKNRLSNSWTYHELREHGAAVFEAKLFQKQMDRLFSMYC